MGKRLPPANRQAGNIHLTIPEGGLASTLEKGKMDLPTGDTSMSITIFQLNRIYRDSLRNMMEWMEISSLTYDWKIGIIDAWQDDMKDLYKKNGFCYGCNRELPRCRCVEPI